ncbi:TraB/GumN family protein [Myroides odoratus]|uniref:TraB/GumN family protein n=1 Tax=Myroides odoratus TaxID=256 RepID=A0A9Q6ZFZ5_MYROD|nr:TraB/GumN family protein [Myroides odoratus]EHQ43376.1 GumN family protein [Myroides odoratus DSM 2801]EKB06040.1 hypothetical protein HMPREF9716_02416 [Myroides odoratus CIP 103059]QQU00715.1 TraB/GumN family protein [Myroides odoratus]WQD57048.1 TraB/GumN family protein [Myroides odoratus]STZ30654.1 TraB family [Myroides odoratus]
MKRLFLLHFLFICTFFTSFAQEQLPKSILWEISGNGLVESSYLLGTFHLVCTEDLHVADKVLTAIEAVDQIALEVNLADIDELMSIQELMVSNTTLSSQLTEEEQEEFRTLLKSKYAIDLEVVDHFPPILAMSMLAVKDIPCEVTGYDMEILNVGLSKKKYFLGLERFKDQIEITNRIYTAKEILTQLREKEETTADFEMMVAAFNQEDIEMLYQMATDSKSLSAEGKTLLLDNRNRAWIEKMIDLMPKERTLFAVGAGHLAGEVGVIALLREKGYTVKAILK